jgi:hypothetical protein
MSFSLQVLKSREFVDIGTDPQQRLGVCLSDRCGRPVFTHKPRSYRALNQARALERVHMADSSCLATSCANQFSDMNVGTAVTRGRPKEWRVDSHSCKFTSEVLLDLRDSGSSAAADTPGQEPRRFKRPIGDYPTKCFVAARIKAYNQHDMLLKIEMHELRI